MQVASRLVVVWLVVDLFPDSTTPSPLYSTMLLAWSISEIIRYSYFVLNLSYGVPELLTWLRYNAFFVLYPLGIGSEMILIWKAKGGAERRGLDVVRYAYWGQLLIWFAGEFVSLGLQDGVRRIKRGTEVCTNCLTFRYLYPLQPYDSSKKEADPGQAARAKKRTLKLVELFYAWESS